MLHDIYVLKVKLGPDIVIPEGKILMATPPTDDFGETLEGYSGNFHVSLFIATQHRDHAWRSGKVIFVHASLMGKKSYESSPVFRNQS